MAKQRLNLSLSPDTIETLACLAEANSTTVSGWIESITALYAVRHHATNLNPSPSQQPYHRRPRVKRAEVDRRSSVDRSFSAECSPAECSDD